MSHNHSQESITTATTGTTIATATNNNMSKQSPKLPTGNDPHHTPPPLHDKYYSSSSSSLFDNLCDDTLLRITLYADLASLIHFTRGTCHSLTGRFHPTAAAAAAADDDNANDSSTAMLLCNNAHSAINNSNSRTNNNNNGNDKNNNNNNGRSRCGQLWQDVFFRHNFAPPIAKSSSSSSSSLLSLTDEDYYNEIRLRLSLFFNLKGTSSSSSSLSLSRSSSWNVTKRCFSLPNRYFYFVPLIPPEMMHFPPPPQSSSLGAGGVVVARIPHLNDNHDDDDNDDDELDYNNINIDNDNNNNNNNTEDTMMMMMMEPPPVEFACDSYSLTSPSTGSEFVLLHPFTGSIEVYGSILDNAIGSEESMLLEEAMRDASEGILNKRRGGVGVGGNYGVGGGDGNDGTATSENDDEYEYANNEEYYANDEHAEDQDSQDIAGDAIRHCMIHQSHRGMYDIPPKQVLFGVQDYFNLDLNDYFGEHTPFGTSMNHEEEGRSRRRRTWSNGNVTVDWVGIDTHVTLSRDGRSLAGNMIGAGRILAMENDAGGGRGDLECMEVLAWVRDGCATNEDSGEYKSKFVCRAAGSPYYLDMCANYKKVYASFQAGSAPFPEYDQEGRGDGAHNRSLVDLVDDDGSLVGDDGEPIQLSKAIFCLPLVKYEDPPSCPEAIRASFPTPEACFLAQYPVSSFIIDPTGMTLLVGTESGTIEIWDTGMNPRNNSQSSPRILQRLSVREAFLKRARSKTMDERRNLKSGDALSTDHSMRAKANDNASREIANERISSTHDDLALIEINLEEEVPHKHPTSKISSVLLSSHQPVQQCGFITKQRNRDSGTTLLLWQTPIMTSDANPDLPMERFQIMAMINLPLSAQCNPEIHYDGKRLIVFGKDHIGLIFLVYHVLSSRFDQQDFNAINMPSPTPARRKCSGRSSSKGDGSGGVVQLHPDGENRIKFVNRIRHAGLAGLEYYDYMSLTANERFVVVNTKTGNLIGSDGARNASQGLLVIDLLEHGC